MTSFLYFLKRAKERAVCYKHFAAPRLFFLQTPPRPVLTTNRVTCRALCHTAIAGGFTSKPSGRPLFPDRKRQWKKTSRGRTYARTSNADPEHGLGSRTEE